MILRQGDIIIRTTKEVPKGLKPLPLDKKRGGYTLALGEFSGHAHTLIPLEGAVIKAWRADNGTHYFAFDKGRVKVLHGTFIAPGKINETEIDKHLEQILYPDTYRQDVKTEYDPFLQQLRKVQD